MRMKTQKALKNRRVAKALLVCSLTVFLMLGTGMVSAKRPPPPGEGAVCVVCGCICPQFGHDGNAPPFCDIGDGNYRPNSEFRDLLRDLLGPGWHGRCRGTCRQGLYDYPSP